jgi:RimJ/RimL family protein N-acetyltransferase
MLEEPTVLSPALIPRVNTARLLLREPHLRDFDSFAADAEDPVSRAFIGGAIDRRGAWLRFHAMAGHWHLQGMGWWIVEERDLGPIGAVGVFRRESGPEVEMGWAIHRPHWNKGYASEAARAALEWAVAIAGARRIIAHIGKTNAVSQRVATKIGMQRDGESDFYGEVDWLYAFSRP